MIGYSGTTTGKSANFTNLESSTSGNMIGNNGMTAFSVEWTGYFYSGNNSGIFTFYTSSDDGSYLWMGDSALSGYTWWNSVVWNGWTHGVELQSGRVILSAYTYYPIRVLYGNTGEGTNGYEMSVLFSTSNGIIRKVGNEFYTTALPGADNQIVFIAHSLPCSHTFTLFSSPPL